MSENPFEQSTLTPTSAWSTPGGSGVEVRYPPAARVLVPCALAFSGVVVPIILFFVLPSPMNGLMAGITALMELSTAGLMWFIFNASFVRADENGITKSQMGKTQSVRWEEIRTMETTARGDNGSTQFTIKGDWDKTILTFSDLSNRKDGAKLRDFITAKLESR